MLGGRPQVFDVHLGPRLAVVDVDGAAVVEQRNAELFTHALEYRSRLAFRESGLCYSCRMKKGILSATEGYDLLVDGVPRTFRDVEANAIDAARELKRRNRNSLVEIRTCATGAKRIMLEDGRLG